MNLQRMLWSGYVLWNSWTTITTFQCSSMESAASMNHARRSQDRRDRSKPTDTALRHHAEILACLSSNKNIPRMCLYRRSRPQARSLRAPTYMTQYRSIHPGSARSLDRSQRLTRAHLAIPSLHHESDPLDHILQESRVACLRVQRHPGAGCWQ